MARGSIGKRGNYYHIRFYGPDGRQRWESGFRTKKQAENALAERLSQTNTGYRIPKGDITIEELANRWLELKRPTVRPKVFSTYKSNVRRFVDNFGEFKVKNAAPEELEQFIASLGLAPATINRQITIIKAIFEKAIEWNYLSVNPARFLKRRRVVNKEIEVLTFEEIQRLVESADKSFQSLILTACYSGMRLSEILALRWSDVDFNSNTLYVRQVLQNGRFFEPKTDNSRRQIAVPQFLIDSLKVHQVEQAVNLKANEHDLVFTTEEGDFIDGVWFSKCVFSPALKRAGIRKVNFHALRHSYVSMLIAQGENIKFISKQVGHASAKMTLDIYTHLLPDTEAKAMRKLDEKCTHFALVANQKVRNETK